MNLIVWKVVGWRDIKIGKYAGTGQILRVVLKEVGNEKNTVYLNLPDSNVFNHSAKWQEYLKEGNVMRCSMQPNGKNVNYYEPFQLIKVIKANQGDQEDGRQSNRRNLRHKTIQQVQAHTWQ